MIKPTATRFALVALIAGSCAVPTEGQAFWKKLFGDDLDNAPTVAEMQTQEAAAAALVQQAKGEEASGSSGRALKSYKRAVERYPLTQAAAEAQFRVAQLLEQDGKISSGFDAYQDFIASYKQSPRFNDALQAQFAIATAAKDGAKVKKLGIPFKFDTSRKVEMFQAVIDNAPRGPLAPRAQMMIAEVYEDENSTAKAVSAYLKVAEEYPESAEAAEAQLAIANVNVEEAESTYDAGQLSAAQEALDDYTLLRDLDEPLAHVEEQREILDELGAEQAYKIARFYEKQGKATAAAIYYADVASVPNSPHYAEARQRLGEIAAADPEAVNMLAAPGSAELAQNTLVVPAETDVTGRPDYLGPPTPALRRLANRPRMRASPDAPLFPIEEPPLPTGLDPTLDDEMDLTSPLEDAELLLPGIDSPTADLTTPPLPDEAGDGSSLPLPVVEAPPAPPEEPEAPPAPGEEGDDEGADSDGDGEPDAETETEEEGESN